MGSLLSQDLLARGIVFVVRPNTNGLLKIGATKAWMHSSKLIGALLRQQRKQRLG